MSIHLEQVESVLTRAIQRVLSRGLSDPRIRGITSVTGVRVSADLANATVLVSVMPADCEAITLHGLHHAAAHVRRQVGELVEMRRVPRLSFKLDRSLKKEAEVIAAVNAARVRDEARRADAPHAGGGSSEPPGGETASSEEPQS